jgi:hypothetical protein
MFCHQCGWGLYSQPSDAASTSHKARWRALIPIAFILISVGWYSSFDLDSSQPYHGLSVTGAGEWGFGPSEEGNDLIVVEFTIVTHSGDEVRLLVGDF